MTRQGRILVMDDDESWRSLLTETLQDGGFHADAVATTEEALEHIQSSLYHVLVLDLRMQEGSDREQGMELLRGLVLADFDASVRIIMLTAYASKENTHEAFRQYRISDFLEKQEYDDAAFLRQMEKVFTDELRINLDLEIHWKQVSGPEQLVVNLEIDGQRVKRDSPLQTLAAAELDDLLCRLFHDARSLLVRPLGEGMSGCSVLWVKPFYDDGAGGARVVKFGDFRLIDAEYRNYHEYVEKFIGEGRSTAVPPDGLRRTARLGGIIYSLLGGAVEQTESFGSFYANADIEQIKRVLDGLFFETCKGWYSNPGAQRLLNLTEEYKRELNFTTEGLTRALSEGLKSVQGKQKLRFGSLLAERTFTNPLLAMTGFNFEESTYVCTTHGDLNENNILVDESSHTWLIDFDSTGRGHILRDVAELDSVLRFRLLGPEEATLEERLKMEESLCRPRRFRDIEQLEATFSTDNPAVAKTFAATLHLRTIARRLVLQSDEINEYYVALFYYAVNAIRFYSLSTVQRLHALLSASLIVDLLE